MQLFRHFDCYSPTRKYTFCRFLLSFVLSLSMLNHIELCSFSAGMTATCLQSPQAFPPHLPQVVPCVLLVFRKVRLYFSSNTLLFQFVPLDSAYKWRLFATSLRFYIRSHQATLSLWTLRTFNRFFLQTMVTSHVANSTMCAGVAITFIPMPYSPLQASFRACHDAYAMQWHCTIDFSSFWNPLAPSRRDIGNDFWQYGKHRLKIAFSRNLCLNMTRPARRGFMCLQVCDPCSCPAWLLTRGAVRWPCPSWQCLLYTGRPYMSTGRPY